MPRAFPHQFAWLLNNPVRGLLLSPRTLLGRIPLRPTDRIVELGPGSGYFSLALSAAVPQGHLELVDLQPEMLAKARRRLTARGHSNVGYTAADAGTPLPLAAASFDVAVLVHVLGEVGDQAQCLRSLASVLKLKLPRFSGHLVYEAREIPLPRTVSGFGSARPSGAALRCTSRDR